MTTFDNPLKGLKVASPCPMNWDERLVRTAGNAGPSASRAVNPLSRGTIPALRCPRITKEVSHDHVR